MSDKFSSSGRVLLPATLERQNLICCLGNALRLSDYEYTISEDKYKISVLIGDEEIEINLKIKGVDNG